MIQLANDVDQLGPIEEQELLPTAPPAQQGAHIAQFPQQIPQNQFGGALAVGVFNVMQQPVIQNRKNEEKNVHLTKKGSL